MIPEAMRMRVSWPPAGDPKNIQFNVERLIGCPCP